MRQLLHQASNNPPQLLAMTMLERKDVLVAPPLSLGHDGQHGTAFHGDGVVLWCRRFVNHAYGTIHASDIPSSALPTLPLDELEVDVAESEGAGEGGMEGEGD